MTIAYQTIHSRIHFIVELETILLVEELLEAVCCRKDVLCVTQGYLHRCIWLSAGLSD